MIEFESVYKSKENVQFLYELLKERTPEQSISHRRTPTFEDHQRFVNSKPYFLWNIIKADGISVGSIYLTNQREIGIFIKSEFHGNGYATEAIRRLMSICPGKFLANINPKNTASINLFKKFNAVHIQNTYEIGGSDV